MLKYNETIFIKSYDVDFKGELKLTSIFNYMQEAAWQHAEILNFGYNALSKKNMFWVLSKIKIEINKIPKWNDKITLITFPRGTDSIYAVRDYQFVNCDGEELIKGTSYWLILDAINIRPQKISSVLETVYDAKEFAIDEKLGRVKTAGNKIKSINKICSYNDIDVNQHVNNAIYIGWIIDVFDFDFIKNNHLFSVEINYLYESKIGDEIEISLYLNNENLNNKKIYYAEGTKNKNSNKIFLSKFEWKS